MGKFYKDNKLYLEKYWNTKKNGLLPENLTGKEVGTFWLLCRECGKEWSITSLDLLPFLGECKHSATPKRDNFEKLKDLWDYKTNQGNPEDYPITSSKNVHLHCKKCGGKWSDYDVADVTYRGKGCPFCAGRRVLKGVNDLGSMFPEVVHKFWDFGKNKISPFEVYKFSSQRVHWKCKDCGHSWVNPIMYLTRDGFGCPACSGKQINRGTNDFKSSHPEVVAKFWDYSANSIAPDEITAGSNKTVYCKCKKCGGTWQDTPKLLKGRKVCPVCWGRRKDSKDILKFPENEISSNKSSSTKGRNNFQRYKKDWVYVNSFGGNYPELVDDFWDWDKNNKDGLDPFNLALNSNKNIHLHCKVCGGTWSDYSIATFLRYKNPCPFCSGVRLKVGLNDLVSKAKNNVEKYWDFLRNEVRPDEVKYNSNVRVKLHCESCGEIWDSSARELCRGTGCPKCEKALVIRGLNDFETFNNVHNVKISDKENLNAYDVAKSSNKRLLFECRECGHEWYSYPYTKTGNNHAGCPVCARMNFPTKSRQEKEIENFLKANYNGVVETSKVGLLPNNLELDIYIPEKKIGIEFNGIYWHSEIYKDKTKHHRKHSLCKERGITLFQIWEDQWRDRRSVIERLLLSKIGVLKQEKVNARDCIIQEVGKMDAKPFMDDNHIQGFVNASIYVALFTKYGEIVALCQFLKTNKAGEFNLNRYATCKSVRGGFTKVTKYFERAYNPKKIITFSDNDYSDGGLYRNNGFTLDGVLDPDYYYTDSSFQNRFHKFNYRKGRFKNDPDLCYEEWMTERELADMNHLTRVWDSGKIRWVKEY